ncbi:sporulation sigma factor SigF [compost metagenome]
MIEQIIDTLPPRGQIIINQLYLQDRTQAEVAQHLKMSQQGVNKWKNKMIQKLSQTVNY